MTVFDNVAFGLRMRGPRPRSSRRRSFPPPCAWSRWRRTTPGVPASSRRPAAAGGHRRAVVNKPLVLLLVEPPVGPGHNAQAMLDRTQGNCDARSASPSSSSPTTRRRPLHVDRVAVMNEGVIRAARSERHLRKAQKPLCGPLRGRINTFEAGVVSRNPAPLRAMVEGEEVRLSRGGTKRQRRPRARTPRRRPAPRLPPDRGSRCFCVPRPCVWNAPRRTRPAA
jgi:ABC-type sulfate/molybdate transport systems ATPase subunit